jgi:hypothetical protein
VLFKLYVRLGLLYVLREAVANLWCAVVNLNNVKEDSIQILSHALPLPCTQGHVFPTVISAIHKHTQRNTRWISVFHAVPGRFEIGNLPTSPPSTPGPAIGGDDYFTSKVFDSAVQIFDYQGDSTVHASPRPLVPPLTVSIVERYIPPTNSNEFAEMFSPTAIRSIVVDRLIELSSDNGVLLLVYPTRAGAKTFMNSYLGPIIAPLLRSLTVVHDLTSDFGSAVGTMEASSQLPEYDRAKEQLENLCRILTANSANMERFGKKPLDFDLMYAKREEVMVPRQIWAEEWFIKQEKPRIRAVVEKYFKARRTSKASMESEIVVHNLIDQIFKGLKERDYGDGQEPTQGIEVGVFVVKKCAKA